MNTTNIYSRIITPLVFLLVTMVVLFGWIINRQLDEEVAASLRGYAQSLNQMVLASLKEAMKRDDRKHLKEIIKNYGKLKWVSKVQIIDKEGEIFFSSKADEEGEKISRVSTKCTLCHRSGPAPKKKMVISKNPSGTLFRTMDTIWAEKACLECHETKEGKALGTLLVDLNMEPLTKNVKRKANQSLAFMLISFLLFLGLLFFVIRKVVVGRLQNLGGAVEALRRGTQLAPTKDWAGDEIDNLEKTLAALSADLWTKQLAMEIHQWMDREFNGHDFSILLVDASGEILLANSLAQRHLSARYEDLVGKKYRGMDPAREALWREIQHEEKALYPSEREDREAGGADFVLLALREADDKVLLYLEVGKREEDWEENLWENEIFPSEFFFSPYKSVEMPGKYFLKTFLHLVNLSQKNSPLKKITQFDPTFANGLRLIKSLKKSRHVLDNKVGICDLVKIARLAMEDGTKRHAEQRRWYQLLPQTAPVIGHEVLFRQLILILFHLAQGQKGQQGLFFIQHQHKKPRFFLGIWFDGEASLAEEDPWWELCQAMVWTFHGDLEYNPSYDGGEITKAYASQVPPLGKGNLFLCEFPTSLREKE